MSKIINVRRSRFQYRYLARFIVEAVTPLAVGSGENDLLTDAPVALDVNGFPYIPGTAIAGVIRHQLDSQNIDTNDEWGGNNTSEVLGSNIVFSEARILDSQGKVIDGMNLQAMSDDLLQFYKLLPVRQHVRITDKGIAADAGKFDEQVVFAGTRFCFEIEWYAVAKDDKKWNLLLAEFFAPCFRLGSGTRCGFGEMKVVGRPQSVCLDLCKKSHLNLYLSKSSELQMSGSWEGWQDMVIETSNEVDDWEEYQLHLSPENLFLFAAAGGDEKGNADTTFVKENIVKWNSDGIGHLELNQVLIPATSVKGAISHRLAFHYNRLTSVHINIHEENESKDLVDFVNWKELHTGGQNHAVNSLFGTEGILEEHEFIGQKRGNVILSDVILDKDDYQAKLVNHVTIDDFTGAAITGHLFTEQPIYGKGKMFTMKILVRKFVMQEENIRKALENTFCDICEGQLPLGGGVYRGNGLFVGFWNKLK